MHRLAGPLLLAALFATGCGDDAQPGADDVTSLVVVPAWATVAPEQIAEAKKHGVPVAFENGLGMRFVLIPAGTFLMGSPKEEEGRDDDETQHEVTLTKPYYIQITEVTNVAYNRHRPEHDSGGYVSEEPAPDTRRQPIVMDGDRQPVIWVTWEDATAYAAWLSRQDEERAYALPTEAQWEYACRAGTETPYWFGRTISTDEANFPGSGVYGPGNRGVWQSTTKDVGIYPPNGWGLHDMHGNAAEWCADWCEKDYADRAVTDPAGPSTPTTAHVHRGGSWYLGPALGRSAARRWVEPEFRDYANGFRLVSPLPEATK